jgi:hypothetical protein
MSRPLDPGFEVKDEDDSPWKFGGSGSLTSAPNPVFAGLQSAHLGALRSIQFIGGSTVGQQIPTTPGELIAIAAWLYADAGAVFKDHPVSLRIDLNPGDGSNLTLKATVKPSQVGGLLWVPHIYAGFTATGTQTYLQWQTDAPITLGSASWFLDEIRVVGDDDVAKRSRWLAHQRLVSVLKGINGAAGGYHTDLQNRVFTKYVNPVGATHPALPYLCVPLVNTALRIEHTSETWFRMYWTVPVQMFVAETNPGAYETDAVQRMLHLTEDIYRALIQDPTLNHTVAEMTFGSGGIEQGGIAAFDGLPYGGSVVPIELSQVFGLDVLGP